MNVVLLYPKTGMDFGSTIAPPHALLSIAAPLLKAGYTVKIIDERVDDMDLSVITNDTICVGISCMTGIQVKHALQLAKLVRSVGNAPIVWGGCHPSVMPVQTAKHDYVDYVMVGEGEYTFEYLVHALSNGKETGRILYGTEVDMETMYPTPWELVDVEKYVHPDMYLKGSRVLDIGQTSRGCPFQCSFCSSASIRGRKWRRMSVGKSVGMITDAVRRFNLDGIWLRDDEFYIDRDRADRICRAIEPLGIRFYTSGTRVDVFNKATDEQVRTLKRAGAYTLKFGAESGCQETLDKMHKGITPEMTHRVNQRCKRAGIRPAYSLIIGYMGETFKQIDNTIDFAYSLEAENPDAQLETMAIYTALPGTPDWEKAVGFGLKCPETLEGWADWIFDEYDLEGKRTPWFTRQERIWLGNISYMSILANALPNVVGSLRAGVLKRIALMLAIPVSAFYRWRLRRRWYRFAPELFLIRELRRCLMY